MTTQTDPSPEFPPQKILCVGAIVLRDDKALWVRQTYGYLKGKWSTPWGFVDWGDTPDGAAVRETLEEAGVVAEVEGLIGVQNRANPKNGRPNLYLIYLCRHVSGEPTPDHVETDAARYFSLAEMETFEEEFDDFGEWVVRRVLVGDYRLLSPMTDNPYTPDVSFF
jgi:ADP-ribose pyrophosphatase YjhB (NUDIX family)